MSRRFGAWVPMLLAVTSIDAAPAADVAHAADRGGPIDEPADDGNTALRRHARPLADNGQPRDLDPAAPPFARFGSALAIGNLDGAVSPTRALLPDLAIGAPGSLLATTAGAIALLRGTPADLATPWLTIDQTFAAPP